jgi:preprotein translocase subunit SecB
MQNDAGAQNPQQQTAQPNLMVVTQFIKDLSFENPSAPASLIDGWGPPETGVQISMHHRHLRDDAYECAIHLRLEARKKGDNKICFIIDLTYGAVVIVRGVAKDQTQAVLMVEVPKLLFPFAREIISSLTHNGGYPPLYLAPVNFEAIYMTEIQRLQADQKKKSAS